MSGTRLITKHTEQPMLVLLTAVHVIGVPEHVTTEDPMMDRSLFAGSVMADDQVAVPDGTLMVSPLAAAVTQSLTSVREALAATRFTPEPPQQRSRYRAAAAASGGPTASISIWCARGSSHDLSPSR